MSVKKVITEHMEKFEISGSSYIGALEDSESSRM
jgi:hypothetical protein